MKRMLVVGLAVSMLLVFSAIASADAPSPAEPLNLAEQVDRITALKAEISEGRKELIKKQADAGLITQEQADRMIKWIESKMAQAEKTKPTKEDLKELAKAYAKQLQLQKELIKEKVKAGLITPEQGRNMLRRLEAFDAYRNRMQGQYGIRGLVSGRGRGMVFGHGRGMAFGRGQRLNPDGPFHPMMNRGLMQRYLMQRHHGGF